MLIKIFGDPSLKCIRRQFICTRQAGDIFLRALPELGSVIHIIGQTDAMKKYKAGYAGSGHRTERGDAGIGGNKHRRTVRGFVCKIAVRAIN